MLELGKHGIRIARGYQLVKCFAGNGGNWGLNGGAGGLSGLGKMQDGAKNVPPFQKPNPKG
jgi:hypothetical protein